MRRGVLIVFVFVSVFFLSLSLVSAGWFGDLFSGMFNKDFRKYTGNVISTGPTPTNGTNATHLECRNMQCISVNGAGKNLCTFTEQCYNTVCQNNTCAKVPGNGSRACWPVGAMCGNQSHLECRSNTCTIVGGAGINQCSAAGLPCTNNQTNQTHLECRNNMCTIISGIGTNQCSPAGSYCNGSQGNSTNITRPDLVIAFHNIFVNVTGNSTNRTVTIVTRVSNIGNAIAAPSTTNIRVFGSFNSTVNLATNALGPGASQDLVRRYNLSRGNWNVYSKADSALVVSESNEFNNERTTPFVV